MTELPDGLDRATDGVRRIIDRVSELCRGHGCTEAGTNYWLVVLLERHPMMLQSVADIADAKTLRRSLDARLTAKDAGEPLSAADALKRALTNCLSRGGERISERDLAQAIAEAAGYRLLPPDLSPTAEQDAHPPDATDDEPRQVRPRRPTATLEQFGRDLTAEAAAGRLGSVSGREDEINLIVETLCRRTKRNPVLVGPAGVGKTAIVEGLAGRIVSGAVPGPLIGSRIFALQPSTLTAGSHLVGELEKRMNAVLEEARQDGVLLFVDEVHSIVGAGGPSGTSDIASLLKPSLARGDVACIAATTDDEYRRFIEPDAALERRFQPIHVRELSAERTLDVLSQLALRASTESGVIVGDGVLARLVDFAARFMPNRRFPDKAVDLFEQCVAHAMTTNEKELHLALVETVAKRMSGIPTLSPRDLERRLRSSLELDATLSAGEIDTACRRFSAAVRGLDVHPERANLTVLLSGDATVRAVGMARSISLALFEGEERVIRLDFSRFQQPSDIAMLLGSPPGYVGYNDAVPLHHLATAPWCVLLCEHIDRTCDLALEVLAQALARGCFIDARGNAAYVADAIVILTASDETPTRHTARRLGFATRDTGGTPPSRADGASCSGQLGELIDVSHEGAPASAKAAAAWIRQGVLAPLSDRYRHHGLDLVWTDSLVSWLADASQVSGPGEVERIIDRIVSPELVKAIPDAPAHLNREVLVSWMDGQVRVQSR